MSDIDLDAILAQRTEATGEVDTVAFTFAGGQWRIKHPLLADDEWKEQLDDLEDADGVGIARHYMGKEQYEKFVAAGGRSGFVVLVIREIGKELTDLGPEGRPTRSSTSSRRRRKR